MKQPSKEELEKAVNKFNEEYKVGDEVLVMKTNKEIVPDVLRSKAWILGGHTVVVSLVIISGCYDASRIHKKPIPVQEGVSNG